MLIKLGYIEEADAAKYYLTVRNGIGIEFYGWLYNSGIRDR